MRLGDTPDSPLTTRDTVLRLTPASAATSRIVALPVGDGASGVTTGIWIGLTTVITRATRSEQHFAACRAVGAGSVCRVSGGAARAAHGRYRVAG